MAHSCAFYVIEAQTGLRTAVEVMCQFSWGVENEETAEKARERRSREAEHDTTRHQRHRVGMLHSVHRKQTVPTRCPYTLHTTNSSISPTGQRTEASKQQCHLYRPCSSRAALVNWPFKLRMEMLRSTNTQWKPTPVCHLRTRQSPPSLSSNKNYKSLGEAPRFDRDGRAGSRLADD